MTIDTSAALGTITQLFAAGQYKNVELGVGSMPGPASPDGGVLVGGAANYIVNKSSPEKQAASYEFAKYLATATGAVGMGGGDRLRAGVEVGRDDRAAVGAATRSIPSTRSRTTNSSQAPVTSRPRGRSSARTAPRAKACAARSSTRSGASSTSARPPSRPSTRPRRRRNAAIAEYNARVG